MWWNDAGTGWGWTGCVLVVAALLAFWGAVIALLIALFGTTRPWARGHADASSDAPEIERRQGL
jgi:hypothetical protein